MGYEEIDTRLAAVRDRIDAACLRSGRDSGEVGIVAVTKTHPPEAVEAVRAAGLGDAGENRVQELEQKVAAVGRDTMRWHLIGRLQRNKVKRALELADLIHSVDSHRLARKISEEALSSGRRAEVLVQLNVSGEATKGGFGADEAEDAIGEICALQGVSVVGLMTMAPFVDDEKVLRSVFSKTRQIAERAAQSIDDFEARHLSMGMSGDFEIAVEEGSTLVRLGTILLGERQSA